MNEKRFFFFFDVKKSSIRDIFSAAIFFGFRNDEITWSHFGKLRKDFFSLGVPSFKVIFVAIQNNLEIWYNRGENEIFFPIFFPSKMQKRWDLNASSVALCLWEVTILTQICSFFWERLRIKTKLFLKHVESGETNSLKAVN